jgi:hypothetical protein
MLGIIKLSITTIDRLSKLFKKLKDPKSTRMSNTFGVKQKKHTQSRMSRSTSQKLVKRTSGKTISIPLTEKILENLILWDTKLVKTCGHPLTSQHAEI